MITLRGKRIEKTIEPETGLSILETALKHEVDWGFSCTRGTCARCRCQVEVGMDLLNEITDAEWDRLDDDELDEGFRLGCQAVIEREGELKVTNKSYF